MRARIAMVISLLMSGAFGADSLKPVPVRGSPISAIYRIGDVHEARTDTDVVRAYYVSQLGSKDSGESVVLQAISDNRAPSQGKSSRVLVWNLGGALREIHGITIVGTKVSIKGWGYTQGDLICVYVLQFNDGVLSDTLDDQGCTK